MDQELTLPTQGRSMDHDLTTPTPGRSMDQALTTPTPGRSMDQALTTPTPGGSMDQALTTPTPGRSMDQALTTPTPGGSMDQALERMVEQVCHAARHALHKRESARASSNPLPKLDSILPEYVDHHTIDRLLTQVSENVRKAAILSWQKREPVKAGIVLSKLRRATPKINDPDTADCMLKQVMDKCPPLCCWMVAVVYDRVESLFHLDNDLTMKAMDMPFLKEEAVPYLCDHSKWASISAIYDRCPRFIYFSQLVRCRLIDQPLLEKDPAAVELFGKIVRHADMWDPKTLDYIVSSVVDGGGREQFRVLVNIPSPAVRKKVADSLVSLMKKICKVRLMWGVGSPISARLGACLMVAAQAGLFAAAIDSTTAAECMVMAATANQPDLVQCLHHCATIARSHYAAMLEKDDVKAIGSQDPARLWGLGNEFITAYLTFDDKAKKTALGIKSFLTEQASTLPSLQRTAFQRMSKLAGWGHGREERIRRLKIPEVMKNELCYKGLEQVLVTAEDKQPAPLKVKKMKYGPKGAYVTGHKQPAPLKVKKMKYGPKGAYVTGQKRIQDHPGLS